MNVRVKIDRLTLDGLPITAAQGAAVRKAVEAELARRLQAKCQSPPCFRQTGAAIGNSSSNPTTLGKQIARAIHSGGKRRAVYVQPGARVAVAMKGRGEPPPMDI